MGADVLPCVAGAVWDADPNREGECPDHAIPKVGELADWLPECPFEALNEAMRRASWLHACFTPAAPDVARLDWRHEYHRPTARWLAFGHALQALGYHLVRAGGGADVAAFGFHGDETGIVTAAEIEALDTAWRAVCNPENPEPLAGWFDVTAEQSAAWLAAGGLAPSVARVADTDGFIAAFPEGVRTWRDAEWAADGHPLNPLVRAWQWRALEAEPFRVRGRASLPRFDRTTIDEARLLASMEPAQSSGQFELLHTDDVVDSCPTWLLGMYLQARSIRTGRKLGPTTRSGLPWSFSVVIGGLAHYGIRDRLQWAPMGRTLPFGIDEIIGWLHPDGWANRARDWGRLDDELNETQSYRVTALDGLRYWVVSAWGLPSVYSPEGTVKLVARVPPSAAHGARFDWRRYLRYAKQGTMQRAVLSVAGCLDKTAHHGNPLTRFVREPVLDADLKPKRERIVGADGKPKRDARGRFMTRPMYVPGKLVPNPLLGSIQPAILPDRHVALFLGLADGSSNRRNAREALETLHADGAIDLERVRNGYRIFGASPKPA